MKKIIICMILSLFSLLIASGSFLNSISVYFRDKDHDKAHKKRDIKKQDREISHPANAHKEKNPFSDATAPENANQNITANPPQEQQAQREQAPHADAM